MDNLIHTENKAARLLNDDKLNFCPDAKHELRDSNFSEITKGNIDRITVKSEQTNVEEVATAYGDEETYKLNCSGEKQHYNKMDDYLDIKEESIEPGHYEDIVTDSCNLKSRTEAGLLVPSLNKDGADFAIKRFNDVLLCDHCNRKFACKAVLSNHVKNCNVYPHEKVYSYNVSSRKSDSRRKIADIHRCSVCEKQFTHPWKLKLHMQMHTGEKPYACNLCDKRFAVAVALTYHIRSHSDDKPYSCDICKKKLKHKRYLKSHLQLHIGEKPLFQCSYCNRCFTNRWYMQRHTNYHTGEDLRECDVCHKKFALPRYLKIHMMSHSGKKPYECTVCNRKFTLKNHLTKHKTMHLLDPFKYSCDHCDLKFKSKWALFHHIYDLNIYPHNKSSPEPRPEFQLRRLESHGIPRKGDPYECAVCNKKFSRRYHFSMHVRSRHTGEKPFACTVCKRTFARREYITVHMRVHTGENNFKCSLCDKTYTTKTGLIQHLPSHTAEKRHRCDICHKKFSIISTLKKHIGAHRNDTNETLGCNHCGNKFASKSSLSDHMIKFNIYPHTKLPKERKTLVPSHEIDDLIKEVKKQNHIEKKRVQIAKTRIKREAKDRIKTEVLKTNQPVNIKTENSNKNTNHLKVPTKTERRLEPSALPNMKDPNNVTTKSTAKNEKECPICFKVLSYKYDLRIHMKIHTGERAFACTVCDKKFQLSKTLKIHLRTHTGEKPYQCDVCKKGFSVKSILQGHMRMHTGDKPFQCHVCKRRFASKTNMSTHMITHSNDKKFICNVCGKGFTRSANLKQHMRRHDDDRPYACNMCDKKYLTMNHLRRHMKSIHAKKYFG